VSGVIVGVSSPKGRSRRAILRMSGPRALEIAARVAGFQPVNPGAFESIPAALAEAGLPGGLPARLYVMRGPGSYTREDVVELHIAGSPFLLRRVLARLVDAGARPAGPGEFTRRAFENGRIDLLQAEAVMRVVRARAEAELRAAAGCLAGESSRRLGRLREGIVELLSLIEAALDFADEEEPAALDPGDVRRRLENLAAEAAAIAKSAGPMNISGAVRVALVGPVNAGKSSLLNRIAGAPRALVDAEPGTTRDPVEATVRLDGMELAIRDTAGMGGASGRIELDAVAKSLAEAAAADLAVVVLDGSRALSEQTASLASIPSPWMLAINKSDLPAAFDERIAVEELSRRAGTPPLAASRVSALHGENVGRLMEEIRRAVVGGSVDRSEEAAMFSERQRSLAGEAASALGAALRLAESGAGEEIISFEARTALDALGRLGGRGAAEDVLDRIFERFCIGK